MSEVVASQIQTLSKHLIDSYGPMIGYQELAEILSTSSAALRRRKSRHDDLPQPLPGLVSCRWATPVIAAWLMGVESTPSPRRPGRPRNLPQAPAKRGGSA